MSGYSTLVPDIVLYLVARGPKSHLNYFSFLFIFHGGIIQVVEPSLQF